MEDDDVLALANFDGTQVYVVRIDQKERTEDELRQAFLESFDNSRELDFIFTNQMQQKMRIIRGQAFSDAQYDRQALITSIQQSMAKKK